MVIAFALILSAFPMNRQRPKAEIQRPTADFVRASGKCAECDACMQHSVVHEYEMSAHAKKGINCLDCHQPRDTPASGAKATRPLPVRGLQPPPTSMRQRLKKVAGEAAYRPPSACNVVRRRLVIDPILVYLTQ